jgi:hypothetical protein
MWQGRYETTTDVAADRLYRAITDINNWNKWDTGIEFTKLEGPVKKRGVLHPETQGWPQGKNVH